MDIDSISEAIHKAVSDMIYAGLKEHERTHHSELRPRSIAEDGPDKRKARLIQAFRDNERPIKDGRWYDFTAVVREVTGYRDRKQDGDIVKYAWDYVHSESCTDGFIDTLLDYVKEGKG